MANILYESCPFGIWQKSFEKSPKNRIRKPKGQLFLSLSFCPIGRVPFWARARRVFHAPFQILHASALPKIRVATPFFGPVPRRRAGCFTPLHAAFAHQRPRAPLRCRFACRCCWLATNKSAYIPHSCAVCRRFLFLFGCAGRRAARAGFAIFVGCAVSRRFPLNPAL